MLLIKWNNPKRIFIFIILIIENVGEPNILGPIDTGGTELSELCSGNDNSEADVEEGYYDHLKTVFSMLENLIDAQQLSVV